MSNIKCQNCDGTEVDVDPYRGDAVCIECGTLIETSVLVGGIHYDNLEAKGYKFAGRRVSSGRYKTLKNARKALYYMANNLRLNGRLLDIAFNFYKLALMHNFTRGRKYPHLIAACVYLSCRSESTAHLLIDLSDVLQTNAYALGHTYLQLSQTLHIRVPSIDPCLYVLRFANRLEFGDKTHAVATTALRLVRRMMKDTIHTGRRPSGLCGAALLMAARMHDFSRTVEDVVRVVRVHQRTLRRRLLEFGETPSSALTLDEFMAVDLDEEQDPPSFKAATFKEQETLQKVIDSEITPKSLTDLQKRIEMELDKNKCTSGKNSTTVATAGDPETSEAQRFAEESVVTVVQECIGADADPDENETRKEAVEGLGPDVKSFIDVETRDDASETTDRISTSDDEEQPVTYLSQAELMEGIEDDEIDSYIMSKTETANKTQLWNKVNADYLQTRKEKKDRSEKEDGETEKKIKKTYPKKKKYVYANCSAGEAVSKMWASIPSAPDYEEDSEPEEAEPEKSLRQMLCGQREDNQDDYAAEFSDDY